MDIAFTSRPRYRIPKGTEGRIEASAARYGSTAASTVRLCIGAVLPDVGTPTCAEVTPAELAPELDELLDTVSLDP